MWAVYAPHNIKKEWDTLPLKIRMLIKALYDAEQQRTYNWAVEQASAAPSRKRGKEPLVDDI